MGPVGDVAALICLSPRVIKQDLVLSHGVIVLLVLTSVLGIVAISLAVIMHEGQHSRRDRERFAAFLPMRGAVSASIVGRRSAMALMLLCVVCLSCEREPSYNDRTLSYWARVLNHSPHSSVAERLAAVDAITHLALRSDGAVQILARALSDNEPQVRLAAITGLALMGRRARSVVRTIDSVARNDPDGSVRAEAETARQLASEKP